MNLQNVISKQALVVLLSAVLLAGCGKDDSKKPANGKQTAGGAKEKEKEKEKEKGKEAEADNPHDVALTPADEEKLRKDNQKYADAIAHIQSYRDTIRDETTVGNPEKAHRALDNIDFVLNMLKDIVPKNKIPKSKWKEINTTAQNLRELFGKVHTKIDAKEKPDYPAVAKEIEKAIAVLATIKSE